MRLILIVCCCLLGATALKSQTDFINVGVMYNKTVNNVLVAPKTGGYNVVGDGKVLLELAPGQILSIQATNGQVKLRTLEKPIGSFKNVTVKQAQWGSTIKFRPSEKTAKERTYPDNLKFQANGNKLHMTNHVYLEHYVAGVVEAESGKNKGVEYYKVQAIICRTYALKYIEKKRALTYDICDDVQCQVYKGQSRFDPDIWQGVNGTAGMVLVDQNIDLIDASFHSNSGGITANSEDVWVKPLPYLRQVQDTFSLGQRHANWRVGISMSEWTDYLQSKYAYPLQDSVLLDLVTETCDTVRNKYLCSIGPKINRNQVRMDFKLKSAFFNVEPIAMDSLYFVGHGFGHGVGLSQLGAMRMADEGFSYADILHHYYTNVFIIHRTSRDFFLFED